MSFRDGVPVERTGSVRFWSCTPVTYVHTPAAFGCQEPWVCYFAGRTSSPGSVELRTEFQEETCKLRLLPVPRFCLSGRKLRAPSKTLDKMETRAWEIQRRIECISQFSGLLFAPPLVLPAL